MKKIIRKSKTSKSRRQLYSLTADELNYHQNVLQIQTSIRSIILQNQKLALTNEHVQNRSGIFGMPNFERAFTITGSLRVHNLDVLGDSKRFFLSKEGRFFQQNSVYGNEFILRGARYLAAIQPQLSVLQKLKIYYEDISEAMAYMQLPEQIITCQYFELSPILDYIKNALVTLYNAYTHREKLGELEQANDVYQNLKNRLVDAVNESVFAFYQSLVNECDEKSFDRLARAVDRALLDDIIEAISREFRQFKFSSRAVVRSEASHPLVLSAFAYNLSQKYPYIENVFGLPAGGTELACLVHKFLEYKTGAKNRLVLLPMSLHTTKDDFQIKKYHFATYAKLVPKIKCEAGVVNTILVDDNSSTGETVERVRKMIQKRNPSINMVCSVSEADIIRTQIRLSDKGRKCKVANPKLYLDSIAILPVSKAIMKKHDLKEVIESRALSRFYNKDSEDVITKIYNEVVSDAIENKYERLYRTLNADNSILSFKHTFLSNFYTIKINFGDVLYPSTEHAYLCQKYNKDVFTNLTSTEKAELNEIFRFKGLSMKLDDFSNIFYDHKIPAGIVKRISNKLKYWGYEKLEWDDIRLELMIRLQMLKYSNRKMKKLLIETENKYLVEGNDWDDTFWGVSNDRGKNFLGRIIMNIRDHNVRELSTARKKIKGRKIFGFSI